MSEVGTTERTEHEWDPMLSRARELAAAALFCALGVTIPILFHVIGVGRVFLPMHLPVLLGGMMLSPYMAVLMGLITPWASALLTGMPPIPMAVIMCVELAVLAGVASLGLRFRLPVWAAAWLAIIARVLATYILTTTLAGILRLPPQGVGLASVLAGLPGIVLQAIVVPAVAYPIVRRRRGSMG